jgi:hypothetical protein
VYQQQPMASPLPNYQPPPVAQPPVGYPPQWQQQPWQPAMQAPTPVSAGWSAVGILSQFEPPALWAILIGMVTVAVPFMFGRVFFFLPIVGIIAGVRAIAAGKLVGGLVGIVLSAGGGVLTLIGLFG